MFIHHNAVTPEMRQLKPAVVAKPQAAEQKEASSKDNSEEESDEEDSDDNKTLREMAQEELDRIKSTFGKMKEEAANKLRQGLDSLLNQQDKKYVPPAKVKDGETPENDDSSFLEVEEEPVKEEYEFNSQSIIAGESAFN